MYKDLAQSSAEIRYKKTRAGWDSGTGSISDEYRIQGVVSYSSL